MKGFVTHIEQDSLSNQDFRRVLYTGRNAQIVLMSLLPQEEIGEEVHQLDQFIRCEKGDGVALIDGVSHALSDGWILFVPQGARHNIINTGSAPMKLYTVYAPPNHRDGVIHTTKADAEKDEEHFDGKTSE